MSLRKTLDEALDRATSGDKGAIEVSTPDGRQASVDVVDVDRLGVRVRSVKVRRADDAPIKELAAELPTRLRSLPDRVVPVEVDSALGGGIFRTPVQSHDQDYFQVDVRGRDSEVRRYTVKEGEREEADFTLTRDGLGRLLDDLS